MRCTPNALLLGSVGLLLLACGGAPAAPVDAPPTVKAPVAEAEPEKVPETSIEVNSTEPTEILVDGRSIGTTPIRKHFVTPGRHDVTFVDPAYGNRTMTVDIEAGDHKALQSEPAPSTKMQRIPR